MAICVFFFITVVNLKSFICLPPYIVVYFIHINTKVPYLSQRLFNLNKAEAPIVITRMHNKGACVLTSTCIISEFYTVQCNILDKKYVTVKGVLYYILLHNSNN